MRKRHPQRAHQLGMYGFPSIHNMCLLTGIVNCYIYERWKKVLLTANLALYYT